MDVISEETVRSINNIGIDKESALKKLIEQHAQPIIEKIQEKEKKEAAKEFWYNHFYDYISTLSGIDYLIMEEELTPEEAYDEIHYSSDKIMEEGDRLEGILKNKRIIKEIKEVFRDLSGYWVYRSEIIKHAYEKPFGYAGDYQIIEYVYDNKPISRGIGYCFDKYFLDYIYAEAVRGRMRKMKSILHEYLTNNDSNINILNIGCGSCREIRELFAENNFNGSNKIVFSLLDNDINALFYSNKIQKQSPVNIEYKFIRANILDIVMKPSQYFETLAGQNLIYCIGLLDYLPEKIVRRLIIFLYYLLNPGGKLILVLKNFINNKPIHTDWFCDWKFYIRNEEELVNIINKSGIKNSFYTDTSKFFKEKIFFSTVVKNY